MSESPLPVEVEPWSDGHWSRVERELFDKLDASEGPSGARAAEKRPRVGRRVLFGGLAVAAAAGLVFFLRPAGFLGSGDRLRVATGDSASEVTVGESSLVVAPKSLVMVGGDDEHGIDVVLDRGAVTCEVAPRKGRPPFVVDAGGVRVRVMGTRFTVARDETATSVAVDHGVVEVSARGQVTVLHDGERWPSASADVSAGTGANAGVGSGVGANGGVGTNAGVGANAGTGVGANANAGVGSGANGGDTTVPSAARVHAKGATGAVPAGAAPAVRASPTDTGATASAAAALAPPPPPGPSPQEAYESAARIEKSRPEEAAALYRQVVAGGSAFAPSALFALGRLESDRGHTSGARRLLEDYLARYPRGLNADDARALLERMQ